MIVFKTSLWDWDLTNKGLSFNERSNHFTDEQIKSYTFPFTEEVNEDVASKLNFVIVDGIVQYPQRIYGNMCIDHSFYEGYIQINSVQGTKVELTIFYGKETLKVFDKKLRQLPFPVTLAQDGLPAFAKAQLSQSWPDATHQFVKVFRDDLDGSADYELFENFLNNYVYNEVDEEWEYPTNSYEIIEGENTAVNRNVMVPMVYLMEVLRVGFKTEGLDVRGDFVDDTFNHKILMVPQNIMEHFAVTEFLNYNFSAYSSQTMEDGVVYNIYTRSHTPEQVGSYSIKIKINFTDVMAQFFELEITQGAVQLYYATSENTFVNIEENVEINVPLGAVDVDIVVTMKLKQQQESISNFNQFTYEYKEGPLNVFPEVYTIADYLPDMNFREFTNRIRSWYNLKFDYTDNAVYLNYLDNHIETVLFRDKSHLQQVDPKRTQNINNLFKLSYPNEETVYVNKDGQTYDETNYTDEETKEIDIQVLPLKVRSNYGSVTAFYPEEEQDLMFILFDGVVADENVSVDNIAGRKLTLQHIYNNQWQKWLKFRANAETIKDSFLMHFTEKLDMEQGIFKYNKNHLIKSINKKRTDTEYYKVDVESETF